MSEHEIEWKRYNDRINQQYSRERKRRQLGDLKDENKRLIAELAEAREEIARLKKREQDLLGTIHGSVATSQDPSRYPGASKSWAIQAVISPDEQLPRTISTATSYEPPRSIDAARKTSTTADDRIEYELDGSDESCIFQFSGRLGSGKWTELFGNPASQRAWLQRQYSTLGDQVTQSTSRLPSPKPSLPATSPTLDTVSPSTSKVEEQDQDSTCPIWRSLPLHIPPVSTRPLDVVLHKAAEIGRGEPQKHHHEDPPSTEHSPSRASLLSVYSLLNPSDPSEDDAAHSLISKLMTKHHLATVLLSFSRKIAAFYTVALLLRWLTNPTAASFSQLPSFLRPTPLQLSTPHSAWIDCVPFPQARDLIIRNMRPDEVDDFYKAMMDSSVNWPYEDSDIFCEKEGGRMMELNPVFVKHILEHGNWSVGRGLGERFPYLRGLAVNPE